MFNSKLSALVSELSDKLLAQYKDSIYSKVQLYGESFFGDLDDSLGDESITIMMTSLISKQIQVGFWSMEEILHLLAGAGLNISAMHNTIFEEFNNLVLNKIITNLYQVSSNVS